MSETAPVRSSKLEALDVQHGFFTRRSGVSKGIYESLNVGLGSDDKREHVIENRKRVAQFFDLEPVNLLTAYQVHSTDIVAVTGPWEEDTLPKVDGLVTNNPELAIGVLTADCGPVLFADRNKRVVGAAHAGWKGATGGVLENTINAMEGLGANRESITAVLGPTISQSSYEVGPEFVDRLTKQEPSNNKYFVQSERPDHAMFDLPTYIVERLTRAGIDASWTGHCTYTGVDDYFSYRRTTHNNEPDYGRQISAVSAKGL